MSQFMFGADFQRAVLRLSIDNEAFASLVVQHLKPSFFETQALGWVFIAIKDFVEKYGRPPTALVLRDMCRQLDPSFHETFAPTVEAIVSAPPLEEAYISNRIEEFIKRNLIVDGVEKLRSLYNAGNLEETIAFFQARAEEVGGVTIGRADRTFFFDDVETRVLRRQREAAAAHLYTFSTGIPELDEVLSGGLSIGELGLWSAVAKAGKSHLLQWLALFAVRALRIPVLYVTLEGSKELMEDRFDAAFAYRRASEIKSDPTSVTRERALVDEYKELRQLLVIRAYTKDNEAWDTSVPDIYTELKTLRQRHGFKPKLVVVDYLDLLRDHSRRDQNEYAEQTNVVRQLKKLCARDDGYAIWSASQIQRQKPGKEQNPNWIPRSNDIADSIGKIRVVDFHGTIARTDAEKQQEKCRLFAELYRSNAAGRLMEIQTDFAHHRFYTSVLRSTQVVLPELSSEQQLEIAPGW